MNEGDLKLAKGSGILIEKNGGLTIEGTKLQISFYCYFNLLLMQLPCFF